MLCYWAGGGGAIMYKGFVKCTPWGDTLTMGILGDFSTRKVTSLNQFIIIGMPQGWGTTLVSKIFLN